MNAQQLKNSILQMAVQGKLVPQNPHDEPASVLVEKIKAEKEKLIKEKKLKPEKNPSFIFKGADNLPYEKVGKNEPVCIADEVPFDIPDSWEWQKLSSIAYLQTGTTPSTLHSEYFGKGIPFIKPADISPNCIDYKNESLTILGSNKGRIIDKNSVLMVCIGGSIGKCYYNDRIVCCNQQINTATPYMTNHQFLLIVLASNFVQGTIKSIAGGTATPIINKSLWGELFIPLPPLSEQERIVAKIEEIMPYIEKYGEKEDKLREINNNISKKLKQSILQEAVQGKLVPQDSNDEPASVLLENIKAEKAQLIKDGKIKKDKNESCIFKRDNSHYEMLNGKERCIDEEIPFEIPDGWEWVRLKNILQVNPRNYLDEDLETGFMPMPLLKEGFNNSHTYQVKQWKDIKSGFTHFADNDVVIAKITPCFQNRKSAVIKNLPNGFGAGTTELHVLRNFNNSMFMPYVLLNCKTQNFINDGVKNFSGTAGQQRISKDFIEEYLIPVPPILEQKRIINKIKELLPFVDKCGKY